MTCVTHCESHDFVDTSMCSTRFDPQVSSIAGQDLSGPSYLFEMNLRSSKLALTLYCINYIQYSNQKKKKSFPYVTFTVVYTVKCYNEILYHA